MSTYRVNDIWRVHRNMLNASAAVIVYVFLNLTFTFALGRFVDWHLNGLLVVGNYNGSEGRELRVELGVVH